MLAGFDTATDSGTAEQVLAYAEKSFDSPITWKNPAQGQSWTVGPESGTGALHIDITRGDKAYALTYAPPANDSGLDIGTICPPPQLGVEVHVNVSTDGGALSESYDTLLRTSAPGIASLSVPFNPSKLGGSLAVGSSRPNAKLVQLSLDATFMAEGTTGSISGIEQTESGSGATGASSASSAVLAVWPDSPACHATFADGKGLGLSVDQVALGVSGTDALASVAVPDESSIVWADGTQTTLVVGVEATGDGCLRTGGALPVELGGGNAITYPVTISAKSEDGRLDGSYAGQVVVSGSGDEQQVLASAYLDLRVDELAKSGFTGVSVPAGTDGLRLQVESKLLGGSLSGTVQLFAITNPPCLTEPAQPMPSPGGGMSVPGCAGQSRTSLETASWTR